MLLYEETHTDVSKNERRIVMRIVIVKDGMPRRENFRLKDYLNEFVATGAKVARVDFDEGDYKTTKSAYTGFKKATQRLGCPVDVHTVDGKLYLMRTDM